MHAAIGATQTLMRRLGDWWVTVVGDVPAATLRQFAERAGVQEVVLAPRARARRCAAPGRSLGSSARFLHFAEVPRWLARVLFRSWVARLAPAACVALAPCLGSPLAPAAARAQQFPDFVELIEKVAPAVVNIRTTERVSEGPRSPFRRRAPVPQGEEAPRGEGSGFIISADGYVMSNAHVVEGASEVLVTLVDKREFKAKIIGADERSDVALLKIEASGLPAVRIGDVSRLRVGEWVLAIGSPFGLDSTVTAGIVSAKQRETGSDIAFIQTDVAVNPGNSGGPLDQHARRSGRRSTRRS